jgi:DNA polymerase I-like protein with 3'-5' exonuclease and polymerase domains
MIFINADYDGLELRTIAQSCLNIVGKSRMAEFLNSGRDLHGEIASQLLNISYDEVIRRKADPEDEEIYLARQTGKVANFGLNAGLGWRGLIMEALTKYTITLTEQESKHLIRVWRETWPEFNDFFKWVRAQTQHHNAMTFCHFKSNRYRGLMPYTVACNSPSQGLGADATKAALYELSKACYVGPSLLLGSRPVNYIHDEFLVETPEDDQAHDRAIEMARIMTETANLWIPDVPTTATPLLCRRWSKLAKPTYDSNQRLIPWEWKEAA